MPKDDYNVIVYKILKFCYQCLKDGKECNSAKLKEIVEVNEIYFHSVLDDLENNEFIRRKKLYADNEIYFEQITITMAGVEFLDTNSRMHDVATALGKAFETILQVAIRTM